MNITLQISEILSKHYALSQEDAELMYSHVEPLVRNHKELTISFKGIETCSSMFFKFLFGRLFTEFGNTVIELFHFEDIENEILQNQFDVYLKRVLGEDFYKSIYTNHV